MDFVAGLTDFAIFTTISLLWARWSKLNIGLSPPAFRQAKPWVLLYILWCTVEWAIPIFLPAADDYPAWLERFDQRAPFENLVLIVLFAPVAE